MTILFTCLNSEQNSKLDSELKNFIIVRKIIKLVVVVSVAVAAVLSAATAARLITVHQTVGNSAANIQFSQYDSLSTYSTENALAKMQPNLTTKTASTSALMATAAAITLNNYAGNILWSQRLNTTEQIVSLHVDNLLERLKNVSLVDMSILIVGSLLSLITIIGNVLVMVAFKIDKTLQTISNYFLLSLAVADFLIGCISMPLSLIYIVVHVWPLGPIACDIWLAIDYLNSNASVLNLLLISFDRYFSVTRPLTYRAKRTTRRACVFIAFAWIISTLLWPPWIFAWPSIEGRRTVPGYQCYIPFLESNKLVTTITAIIAFWIPVTIMCILYWRVWRETENRYRELTSLVVISPAATLGSSGKQQSLTGTTTTTAAATTTNVTAGTKTMASNIKNLNQTNIRTSTGTKTDKLSSKPKRSTKQSRPHSRTRNQISSTPISVSSLSSPTPTGKSNADPATNIRLKSLEPIQLETADGNDKQLISKLANKSHLVRPEHLPDCPKAVGKKLPKITDGKRELIKTEDGGQMPKIFSTHDYVDEFNKLNEQISSHNPMVIGPESLMGISAPVPLASNFNIDDNENEAADICAIKNNQPAPLNFETMSTDNYDQSANKKVNSKNWTNKLLKLITFNKLGRKEAKRNQSLGSIYLDQNVNGANETKECCSGRSSVASGVQKIKKLSNDDIANPNEQKSALKCPACSFDEMYRSKKRLKKSEQFKSGTYAQQQQLLPTGLDNGKSAANSELKHSNKLIATSNTVKSPNIVLNDSLVQPNYYIREHESNDDSQSEKSIYTIVIKLQDPKVKHALPSTGNVILQSNSNEQESNVKQKFSSDKNNNEQNVKNIGCDEYDYIDDDGDDVELDDCIINIDEMDEDEDEFNVMINNNFNDNEKNNDDNDDEDDEEEDDDNVDNVDDENENENDEDSEIMTIKNCCPMRLRQARQQRHSQSQTAATTIGDSNERQQSIISTISKTKLNQTELQQQQQAQSMEPTTTTTASQQSSSMATTYTRVRSTIQPKSERKAAKTLSAILLAFIVTWTPYNVLGR